MKNRSEIIRALIGQGENQFVDFKRTLNLDSARSKAELIKDILSIANSAPQKGYLLFGIEDDKTIVGLNKFDEEERIQQLAHTYINPPLFLECYSVELGLPAQMVGVIEITGTDKPHKIARTIEQLIHNEVYVRRGSITVKASPEDILRLRDESCVQNVNRQHVHSAQTHSMLGNFESAVNAYTKAIDLAPDAKLFFERGCIYVQLWKETENQKQKNRELNRATSRITEIDNPKKRENAEKEAKRLFNLGNLYTKQASKDFSDAIQLVNSNELEIKIRLARLELAALTQNRYDDWRHDVEWLHSHATLAEFGKVLYLEAKLIEIEADTYLLRDIGISPFHADTTTQIINLLTEAIGYGYDEPDVFFLKAQAHFGEYNFGLALQVVDMAIEKLQEVKRFPEFLGLKANILIEMQKYEQAIDVYRDVQHQFNESAFWYFDVTFRLKEILLCRYAIESEFGKNNPIPTVWLQEMANSFTPWRRKEFKQSFPEIVKILRKIGIEV